VTFSRRRHRLDRQRFQTVTKLAAGDCAFPMRAGCVSGSLAA
jgi:hypothetical protein